MNEMSLVCQSLGEPDDRESKKRLFVSRVRSKLHIIMGMSPVGNRLRIRCMNFPSLVNCCTIDYYTKWPEQALLSVSESKLAEMSLSSEEIRKSLTEMCKNIHVSVDNLKDKFFEELRRIVYNTPKS